MIRHVSKVVAAGLVAAAIGVMLTPASASAASPAVQIQVCNDGPSSKHVNIYGRNQDFEWVHGDVGTVSGGCKSLNGWWWMENSSIEVWWQAPGGKWTWDPYWVSKDHHGKWCTLHVPAPGNNQCR